MITLQARLDDGGAQIGMNDKYEITRYCVN